MYFSTGVSPVHLCQLSYVAVVVDMFASASVVPLCVAASVVINAFQLF